VSTHSSQNDILDNILFQQLLKSSSFHDQAHLQAVLHSSGTSNSWLKTLPQLSLGFAFSPYDFVIALGISLFPLPPLCTCLSVFDQFGDNLLDLMGAPLPPVS